MIGPADSPATDNVADAMKDAAHLPALVTGLAFALAFVFGAVANRVNFCTMGAITDIVNFGDWRRHADVAARDRRGDRRRGRCCRRPGSSTCRSRSTPAAQVAVALARSSAASCSASA